MRYPWFAKFFTPMLVAMPTAVLAQESDLQNSQASFGLADIRLHIGYLTARAHENVYDLTDGGRKISRLVWEIDNAATINVDGQVRINEKWSLFGAVSFGFDMDNSMVDYDYLDPNRLTWTDHSTHPDTELDRYLSLDAGVKYRFWDNGQLHSSALGGAKYTNIKWTARGGDYVYSTDPEYGLFRMM